MFLRRAASTSRFGVVGSTATRGVFGVVIRCPVVVGVSLSWSSSDDAAPLSGSCYAFCHPLVEKAPSVLVVGSWSSCWLDPPAAGFGQVMPFRQVGLVKSVVPRGPAGL